MEKILAIALLTFALAACTQEPAELVDNGSRFYGRDGAESSISISSNGVQESAPVSSVAISDIRPVTSTALAPPSATGPQKNFIWPVQGNVIARFSTRNDGINIATTEGRPIHAAASGTVVYASDALKEYGNMVIIKHPDGFMTAYAHARTLAVKKGASVSQGDIIGTVGKTGNVQTAQLHFGIRNGKQAVDPERYLSKSMAGL